jgi:hypothetical protein
MRTLLLVPIAALTLGFGPNDRADRPAADPRREAVDDAIDRGLEYLARTQTANGSWTMGGGPMGGMMPRGGAEGDVAVTSLAVMAFMSAGHVPGEGRYGDVVERGIRWVLEKQTRDRRLAPAFGFEMYHHGIATLMLAEAVGMTTGELAEQLRDGLEKAVKVILVGQRVGRGGFGNFDGGWRYQAVVPGGAGDADLSVTGWQLMALRAAKNVGCDVPADHINRAVAYVKRSYDGRTGGFQYQPGGQVTLPCTGVGVLCLELSGKEYHLCDEALSGGALLLRNPLRPNDMYFYYGVYYTAQALFQLGGHYWEKYRPVLHDQLLRQASPNGEGAWGGRGSDAGHGPGYCTAMAVLSLTVEYRFLPIYQRFEEPLERDGRD